MACGEVTTVGVNGFRIDDDYEFSAPKFFDFMNDETDEEIGRAELWFENGKSDAPSPFMMRIKASRFAETSGILCNFDDAKLNPEDMESGCQEPTAKMDAAELPADGKKQQQELVAGIDSGIARTRMTDAPNGSREMVSNQGQNEGRSLDCKNSCAIPKKGKDPSSCNHEASIMPVVKLACTPRVLRSSSKGTINNSINSKMVKELVRPSSNLKPKTLSLQSGKGSTKSQGTSSVAKDIALENQAIKRQKLDGGKTRQILNVKNRVLLHKSKPELTKSMDSVTAALHEETGPYVSVAEMIKKFETNTREVDMKSCHSHEDTATVVQRRQRLVLTRPKEPEFQTAHRVRAVRIKSSAELEAEMLSKIPKFKARPVNKKILEAATLPPLPKSAPQAPEFREFNLKTMERFGQFSGAAPAVSSSIDSTCQNKSKAFSLTDAKPPLLETALRARPPKVKTTEEKEIEEMEKMPKFKARPLNKKIFESKGDMGLVCKPKIHSTIPQEFHFATTERLGPPQFHVEDLFDKLSLHSSEPNEQNIPRITFPNPFNLQTEERGMLKEKRFTEQITRKKIEEEKARIPKANPYPYTTDYPVVPPKPQPKECTRPEAFQLESLARHEEEQWKKMEMIERMNKEEAQLRIFKAQPIMKEDPLPLPVKERKPLTEVQQIVLHVDNRAEDRAQFDKKMKEKELMHKRLREENEHAKMIEEEKALKQMRKTMVPHARPLPNFDNPFLPQKSDQDTTKPKSPKLRVAMREERRRRHFMR